MTENHEERARQSQVAAAKETEEALQAVASEDNPIEEADVTPQGEAQSEEAPAGDNDASLTDAPHVADTGASTDEGEVSPSIDQSQQMQEYDQTFIELEPGTIIRGKVVQISNDEVMVDVGYKSEGRIPLHELGLRPGETPDSVLSVGDEIDVYILKVEDAEGNVLLSKRRADARAAWEKLTALKESGGVIEAVVTERVKGGLLVDVGVRGFVPASHVDRNYVEDLESYVGQTIRMKVIELDRQRNNVVLSRKEVIEEEYQRAKEEAFSTLREGDIVKGVVRRLTDFGAFVDIGGGVEGLLHVSEMGWSRVEHPRDVLSEGDEINVMVLAVDKEKERISLSLKETLPDPWDTVDERFHVGDIVEATVTRVVDFGAFVKLEDGVEGLVHISQLANRHVNTPSEVVQPGDEVKVKIVSLDKAARRIGLSIKDAQPKPQRQEKAPREQTFSDPNRDDSITLGDVFEDLQSYFRTVDSDDN